MIKSILDQILQTIIENPDKTAFHINDQNYSYSQLSNYIYSIQINLNEIQGKRIGVVTSNTIETYALQLAIWFSGKVFIPLNPKNPVTRNQKIISEANIKTVFHFNYNKTSEINLNQLELYDLSEINIERGEPKLNITDNSDLAYILFTSGSTGVPKGVQICWGNVESFVDSFLSFDFKFEHEQKFLQMFDFSFDVSVACTIIPLIMGYPIYTISNDDIKYLEVLRIIEEKEITFAVIVPSLLAFIRSYFKEIELKNLNYCILTAEASYNEIVYEWKKCIPNARIFNFYGPTEGTIWATAYEWANTLKDYMGMPPIGKPLKNIKCKIIREDNNETEVNEKGELCLGGGQISPGYFRNSKKNEDCFVIISGERYYKTGDVCFFDKDGDIMYCGRIDHQIQVQGYRVELNELEFPVKNRFKISNAIAIQYSNEAGKTQLILFVESYRGEVQTVSDFLKTILPPYMIPDKIINIEKFPINNSDKVDRGKLLEYVTNSSYQADKF
jgi:amino acid adenylation domain-containing protein